MRFSHWAIETTAVTPNRKKGSKRWIRWFLIVLVMSYGPDSRCSLGHAAETSDAGIWRSYTNPRFGFSVRYPQDWLPGTPMPDGAGITLSLPTKDSQVSLSGFMNIIEGHSPDGRQTLDEFVTAHRHIITELYEKKHIKVSWGTDRPTTLGGFDAKQLTFTYRNSASTEMREIHIMSLGRNEGRGIRIKIPASSADMMMPLMAKFLESYHPGRDQNAVSPFAPPSRDQSSTPHR